MPVQVAMPPLVAPRAQALSLLEALHIVTHMSALYSCSKWDLHLGTFQSSGTRVACGLVACTCISSLERTHCKCQDESLKRHPHIVRPT